MNTFINRNCVVALCVMAVVSFSIPLPADDSGGRDVGTKVSSKERSLAIKGEFQTAIQILPPFPSFPPEPFQPVLHLLITAHGKLLHFGAATAATTDQAVDLSVHPNRGTGHWVFQNARGDTLWTETDLSSTPLDATGGTRFWGTLTVTGGAGRFEGATGSLEFEGAAQGSGGFFSIAGIVHVMSTDEE
jgi:hypothetical protein